MSAGQAAAGRLFARRPRRAATGRRLLAVLPPRLRRWLLVLLAVCLVLAAGYRFWLRDSSLVAVEDVKVTGLTTKDAQRVRMALASAAHSMTTLHVEQAELQQAIAAYPVVKALEVRADFPHGLAIHVIEHRPAAWVGGLPVAGDGTILRGLPVEGKLPKIESHRPVRGNRLTDPIALHGARVAGAAPAAVRPRIELIEMRGEDGIVVDLRDGPELIFGDASNARAKWIAATRVLADPEAQGATYIDVRLPGRPAAGGLPASTLAPVAPAGPAPISQPQTTTPGTTAVDPSTEQLAPPATTQTQPTAPQNAPSTAPQSQEAPATPTDTTGAGGASPPSG